MSIFDKSKEDEPKKFVDYLTYDGMVRYLPRRFSVLLREPEQDDDDPIPAEPTKTTQQLVNERIARLVEESLRQQKNEKPKKMKKRKMRPVKE